MTETFPWFAARLLFEACVSVSPADEPLFEERIVLVHAPAGMDAALKRAHKLGKASADSYQNEAGEDVEWQFREVLDVVQLNETAIVDGSEVYHHYLTSKEVERVRSSLRTGSL